MYIDLSVTLSNQTVTYPTDPAVKIERTVAYEQCGFNVSKIEFGTHSGTHVDVPLHCTQNGFDTSTAPIESFCGEAYTIEIPYKKGSPLSADFDDDFIKKSDILLIRTGWEEKAGTPDFFNNFPYIDEHLAKKLVLLGIKAVGTDMPSFDKAGSKGKVHHIFLDNNIMLIEALVNLKQLVGKRCFFSAVPLKIKNGDGSPVRAYAYI